MGPRWTWIRATAVAALVCVAGAIPAAAAVPQRRATAPVVNLKLSGITCNPAGQPGLRATASTTLSGTAVRSAELVVFEFQPISNPAYAPFTWTGGSVATWINEDAYRSGLASDTRTLDTTDRTTWNRGNYSKDIWLGSSADSWWNVSYTVSTTSRTMAQQQISWYVSCPTGRVVDRADLREIQQVTTTGLR